MEAHSWRPTVTVYAAAKGDLNLLRSGICSGQRPPTASADFETSSSRRDTNAFESAERGWIERVLQEAAPSLDHRVRDSSLGA